MAVIKNPLLKQRDSTIACHKNMNNSFIQYTSDCVLNFLATPVLCHVLHQSNILLLVSRIFLLF